MVAIIRSLNAGGTVAFSGRLRPDDRLARIWTDVQTTDGDAR
jgi:hypothetical protein